MRTRLIAVALIKNTQDEILLLKMPDDFGPYPGQWGIVGGGIEEGEKIEHALIREVWEETGLEVVNYKPLFFDTDEVHKLLRDGTKEAQYLIFLMFEVRTKGEIKINDEWVEHAWVQQTQLNEYDINPPTKKNLQRLGLI